MEQRILKILRRIEGILLMQDLVKKKHLNVKETALYLGVSVSKVYKLSHENKISYFKPDGKLIFFKKSDLDQYLFRNKIKSNDDLESDIESNLF